MNHITSFTLANLLPFGLKIINSAVVVGLFHGFMTTFATAPSYFVLLRAHIMEKGKGEAANEKRVAATTGFFAGQLIIFMSIYNAPLRIALGREGYNEILRTGPRLLFYSCWTSTNNSNNLNKAEVFQNTLILNLFYHSISPSSTLTRFDGISIFRYKNPILFVTSIFVGWLIGQMLFLTCFVWVVGWMRKNYKKKAKTLMQSIQKKTKSLQKKTKSLVPKWGIPIIDSLGNLVFISLKLRNSMDRALSILIFITGLYFLGRTPFAYFIKRQLVEIQKNFTQECERRADETQECERRADEKISSQDRMIPIQEKKEPEIRADILKELELKHLEDSKVPPRQLRIRKRHVIIAILIGIVIKYLRK